MRFETTKGVFLTADTKEDAAILAAQYNMGDIARELPAGAERRSDITRCGQLVDRVLALLRQEWQAGASSSPGFHHQQQALSRAQVASALDIDFEQGDDNV